ncbi:MAG: class I SAM-dependent methyltransferase [Planctomycetes bacterium]|nr:class I SAM-dependent methyltransferase [Planctomycetota bacterium]
MEASRGDVRDKWRDADVAKRYAGGRFASARARDRDPKLVAALLALATPKPTSVLDVPCGTGRLFETLDAHAGKIVGLDASRDMLLHAREASRAVVHGDALHLPLRDGAFDAVVCCRLAHHLHRSDDLTRLCFELARVSRRWVILSFWDSASLPAWRTRVGLKRDEGARGRLARSRREIAQHLESAGLEPRVFRSALRFVSQQTFVLAEKR